MIFGLLDEIQQTETFSVPHLPRQQEHEHKTACPARVARSPRDLRDTIDILHRQNKQHFVCFRFNKKAKVKGDKKLFRLHMCTNKENTIL